MARTSFEIEVELDGYIAPYRPATNWDPAEGGEVEDVEITEVGVLKRVPAPEKDRPSHRLVWATKSILTGVDVKNPEVRKLLDNLLEIIREDAERAIAEDYEERAA